MKPKDRAIVLGVVVAGFLIAFYLMALSPKRQEASKLSEDITALEGQIDQQEQVASFAEEARKDFPRFYGRMVVLGKAVPAAADTSSMLVQLSSLSDRTQVEFRSLTLGQGDAAAGEAAAAAPAAPAAPAPAAPAEGEAAPAEGAAPAATATPAAATTPVPATEESAANLPIGAVVGAAGLPTLPYDLSFDGGFFEVASFLGGIDGLVSTAGESGEVAVNGRLLTIDGFSLKGGKPGSNPDLEADFAMTSFVTPSDEGLTLGATPSAPVSPAATATPASAGGAVVP